MWYNVLKVIKFSRFASVKIWPKDFFTINTLPQSLPLYGGLPFEAGIDVDENWPPRRTFGRPSKPQINISVSSISRFKEQVCLIGFLHLVIFLYYLRNMFTIYSQRQKYLLSRAWRLLNCLNLIVNLMFNDYFLSLKPLTAFMDS